MIVFSYSLYLLFIFAFGVMQSLDKEKELKEAIQIRKKVFSLSVTSQFRVKLLEKFVLMLNLQSTAENKNILASRK